MQYLNKLLNGIESNSKIFRTTDIILRLGLTNTQIKDLKKYALENQLITQSKNEYFLTQKGKEYLKQNPIANWVCEKFPLRSEINVESLKEEKITSVLTKAIRIYSKHLIEKEILPENSLAHAISEDLKKCNKLICELEKEILNDKKKQLDEIYEKFLKKGITKSLIFLSILKIIIENSERIAIYEKSQFQIKFDALMFDRMMACPQNFELQKTELEDEYILKDVSKIILNKKSNNIIEITKGLIATIKTLDKYTMNTQNLNNCTLRLRNIIVNARDPISLFQRDIPKVFGYKNLQECDRKFLNNLKISLNELRNCTSILTKNLESFLFKSFKAKSKEELAERFLAIQEYIGEKDLKILLNSVVDTQVSNELWINRIATFINKSRVPKDWNDEDYADFKVKAKELSLKFFVLEATIGTSEAYVTKNYHSVLNNFLKLTKQEQLILLRNVIQN